MTAAHISWSAIRSLDGSQAKGFEELCAQLARAETPAGARFERKGTPDAGVECYSVLLDGSEWGWQAKYFDTLGDKQWTEIDESVETALEKHPRLVRYFVCTPLDRPDARLPRQKSAMEKWKKHVETWKNLAAGKGMNVEFIYWGSHELLERLTRPEHVGRVRFWFDVQGFDANWFNARLNEALRTAGPRYTPEVHVDLPIALEFEAFGRTKRFFDQVKANARSLRERWGSVAHSGGAADPTIDAAVATLSTKVQAVLSGFSAIDVQPTGPLPFREILERIHEAEGLAEELIQLLETREQELDAKPEPASPTPHSSYRSNPFRDRRFQLSRFTSEIRRAQESLEQRDRVASNSLLLLSGKAGTGKTHLLCDLARQRIAANRPTVLLMGQRFVSHDAPWSQALQQLDLTKLSAEEFVGALESAAQAAGSRALLVIDALNEGAGRTIWPDHLAAFLTHVESSPWVGVVLAVRSSYEEIVVSEDVRKRAAVVTHLGFSEHEYDAVRTFFEHYSLELPSTPLLAPEFRNPLFLKTLCQGLHTKGERRLPRGLQGMTAVFDLYLESVNQRLASTLDFNPRTPLVRRALEAIANGMLDAGESWLALAKAEEVVNALLPGRGFERSLYRGLVAEGALLEEAGLRRDMETGETVSVAYERLSDHLAAKRLLDRHLDAHDPASAFAPNGPLAFICDETKYVSPGQLEALCIQIPERIGRELVSIAPNCAKRWALGGAFRQSLVWRSNAAFSDDTRQALNVLSRSIDDRDDTLDVLLTVAVLPGHPLNARFLDRRLRKDAMAERDAWWSIYLHKAWRAHGAVDRLVDWASSLDSSKVIDEEAVDLCAIALSWMLTTSNRFLRDRATTALVSLLTGRLPAVVRLVEHFVDVDDLYVAERVYAVAYGVAMRCHDPSQVGALATCVYGRVFASGRPPPHILLRDYARGVVERALHLGAPIDVVPERIRPPYSSIWPAIPTDEELKPLLLDRSTGSYESGALAWGRHRIEFSVMHDDFARYVIGTNSSLTSREWLSLQIDEPSWTPPPRPEDQLRALVAEFSAEERKAWDDFEAADKTHAAALRTYSFDRIRQWIQEAKQNDDASDLKAELEKVNPPEVVALKERANQARTELEAVLTEEHAQRLEKILAAEENDYEARKPPRLDLRQIQRYIFKRVFDLGWNEERFGYFDRFSVGDNGREASKAERIGKKYQWIAYHEILALVSDRFQYREEFREEEGDKAYEGPWQDHLRDIDPSCTMRSLRGGTSLDGYTPAWWGPTRYEAWGEPNRPREWVLNGEDLPNFEDLLIVVNPTDGSRWLNVQSFFNWKQPTPADRSSTEVERRELWYLCTGYLVHADDVGSFLKWAKGVDFWGRWMPEAPEVYRMFLGEHGWAPASRYLKHEYYGDSGWTQPEQGCPVNIQTIAFEYLREARGFDCSVDESYTLRLPKSELVAGLGIRWSGHRADFVDSGGRIVAQDSAADADGPSALLLRESSLRDYLAREKLAIVWAVLGEKRVLTPGWGHGPHHPALHLSGAYVLGERGLTGFMKRLLDDPSSLDPSRLS